MTCLHLACISGNLEIVRYLVEEHNFDCCIRTLASNSEPIHVAVSAGNRAIVEYLVNECDVDPLSEDRNGENCLTLAIKNRKRDVGIWLVGTCRF